MQGSHRKQVYRYFSPTVRVKYHANRAADFVSPSSYEGISYALDSGRLLAEAFEHTGGRLDLHRITDTYERLVSGLRRKLILKEIKRRVIFSQHTRNLILRTGIASLKI